MATFICEVLMLRSGQISTVGEEEEEDDEHVAAISEDVKLDSIAYNP